MKLIIHAPDNCTVEKALSYVSAVVSEGLVSKDNTQYAYCTRFSNGALLWADKTKTGTFVFRVLPEES